MEIKFKRIFRVSLLSLLFFSLNAFALDSTTPTASEIKSKQFVNYMATKYHFNQSQVNAILEKAKYNQEVIAKITHPYEKKPWNVYRAHFITKKRITDGVAYWNQHEKVLAQIQKRYGIPPHIILAILGVETDYGTQTGSYSVLDALSTLAFYYPPRERFFTRELSQLFLLTKEKGFSIFDLKSSYAGAIGIPQFMPSDYREYAVNYQQHGPANLMKNDSDAMASVANYLKLHGWKPDAPIASPINKMATIDSAVISDRARPRLTINQLKNKGIKTETSYPDQMKAAVVELKNEKDPEYWLTFHNFQVIMRYNPRIIYAMTVYQLSKAIKQTHDEQVSGTRTRASSTRKT